MSTLVIHPKDSSTDFLKTIYAPIENKTIITGGVSKSELQQLIMEHDRVIMLGHGTPAGLLSVSQFPDAGFYIIDDSFREILSEKKNNIFIWCHADQFVKRHNLIGFCTGMFISELEEAWYYDFWVLEENKIEVSNERFASIVGKNIEERLDVLYENVLQEYSKVAETNPIAEFNLNRLFVNKIEFQSIS